MEETTSGTSPESTVDYKAELEKAQELISKKDREIEQARFTLTKKNIEEKKSKVFANKDEGTDDEPADIDGVIERKVQETLSKRSAEDYLSKHSSNSDEVELARFHLEHTIRPSGNPEVDALAALSVANQATLRKQNQELKTTVVNRNQTMATSQASGSSKQSTDDFSKNLTTEQLATLRGKHGMNDTQIKMFLEKRSRANS